MSIRSGLVRGRVDALGQSTDNRVPMGHEPSRNRSRELNAGFARSTCSNHRDRLLVSGEELASHE